MTLKIKRVDLRYNQLSQNPHLYNLTKKQTKIQLIITIWIKIQIITKQYNQLILSTKLLMYKTSHKLILKNKQIGKQIEEKGTLFFLKAFTRVVIVYNLHSQAVKTSKKLNNNYLKQIYITQTKTQIVRIEKESQNIILIFSRTYLILIQKDKNETNQIQKRFQIFIIQRLQMNFKILQQLIVSFYFQHNQYISVTFILN
ncbi:hypothetical protein TTHERM_001473460 (macronuclear) [Tetrahymena thermophila SB210]|uniref:Uncharacterized protein n=1 Tax=Tetrahymena thermophila (strain SB210) TaxID=312017 RepID=W7X8K8_TETTS|nr:hypothetical protein TTHERM_001473460 [Tetrahymena thermophila SB210]EWS73687.1 hypothetical protein TTHERM_001473460 [Tetrahymena thermophila SB210]|eukprot:XP_012653817.1 hypothetical protein TTHERM_001473460 [Tetrahymena thermophila SB210]